MNAFCLIFFESVLHAFYAFLIVKIHYFDVLTETVDLETFHPSCAAFHHESPASERRQGSASHAQVLNGSVFFFVSHFSHHVVEPLRLDLNNVLRQLLHPLPRVSHENESQTSVEFDDELHSLDDVKAKSARQIDHPLDQGRSKRFSDLEHLLLQS